MDPGMGLKPSFSEAETSSSTPAWSRNDVLLLWCHEASPESQALAFPNPREFEEKSF